MSPYLYVPLIFLGMWLIPASFRWLKQKIRSKKVSNFCQKNGYSFTEKIEDYKILNKKNPSHERGYRFRNLFEIKQTQIPFVVHDGKLIKKKRRNIYFTEAWVKTEQFNLPDFQLEPSNLRTRINSAMGIKDINFEENKTFSENYELSGKGEIQVRDLFDTVKLSFFENNPGWKIYIDGYDSLRISYKKGLTSINDLPEFIKTVEKIIQLFQANQKAFHNH